MSSFGIPFLSAPKNVAAWALKPKQRPLTVASAPYTKPPAGHVVIKVYDVAINPIDWILQDDDIFGSKYPTVFGSDVGRFSGKQPGSHLHIANVLQLRSLARSLKSRAMSKTFRLERE